MSGAFKSPKPSQTPPPEKIGQITPTGTSLFGTIDPETGEFVTDPAQTVQQTTETPFAEEFRTGTESLRLGVLGQLGNELQSVRGSEGPARFIPRAGEPTTGVPTLRAGLTDTRAGLPELTGAGESWRTRSDLLVDLGVRQPLLSSRRERLSEVMMAPRVRWSPMLLAAMLSPALLQPVD